MCLETAGATDVSEECFSEAPWRWRGEEGKLRVTDERDSGGEPWT